jgi:hypothetical protein
MSDTPALINPCLITNDVNQFAAFYAQVLQIEPHTVGEDYVEFRTAPQYALGSPLLRRRNTSWLRNLGPEPQRDSGV